MDRPPPQKKTLATVVLLTKDEYDLVDDFLTYHSALFGAENVVVVDNGSTDARLRPVYRRHKAAGVRFILERREFAQASDFMTEHMRALADGCRFLLPLETDEFIFLMPEHPASASAVSAGIEATSAAIREHLEGLPEEVSVLRYGAFLGSCVDPADAGYSCGAYSRPVAQITRFKDQGWDKLIVRSSAFDRMAVWCHHASCNHGTAARSPLLGLLHFHETGRRRLIERAMPVVKSYRHLDFERDTDADRLAKGRILVRRGLVCGHKLEYVLDHTTRLLTLQAFRRYLGRLPASAEEMLRVVSGSVSRDAMPDAEVRALPPRPTAEGASSSPLGWDELLYHEDRQQHAFVVRQVADALGVLRR